MTKVVLVGSDLSFTVEEMPSEDESLDYLQGVVGGYVQAIDLQGKFEGFTMWMNEEGKLTGLPFNDLATIIWELSYGPLTDLILGECAITGGVDKEGNTLGLDAGQVAYLDRVVRTALV